MGLGGQRSHMYMWADLTLSSSFFIQLLVTRKENCPGFSSLSSCYKYMYTPGPSFSKGG